MPGPRSFEHEHISPEDLRRLEVCESRVGYRFKNPDYLHQALTHSSIKTIEKPCNERMEFLGDSVLGVIITEFLFNFYGDLAEGDLTQIKSVVVSTNTLAAESERLELDIAYNVGKGVTTKKKLPTSLLANVFEAVVGAIYLDGGIQEARSFCLRNLYHQIMAVNQNRHPLNYKSLLQQHLQKTVGRTPTYRVVGESGPDHSKTFRVQAMLGKRKLGFGQGKNKKEAEQAAAQASLDVLDVDNGADPNDANGDDGDSGAGDGAETGSYADSSDNGSGAGGSGTGGSGAGGSDAGSGIGRGNGTGGRATTRGGDRRRRSGKSRARGNTGQ